MLINKYSFIFEKANMNDISLYNKQHAGIDK